MKNGSGHGGRFIQRWLFRSSNASNSTGNSSSDTETHSADTFSPPPLTDSSSTSASSSEIQTPKASPVHFSRKHPYSRFAVVKTPRTPPTRYTELPLVQTNRKVALSLPANAQRPTAVVVAQPHLKLHRLLSYYPMRQPLIYDITSPPSYILQIPSQIISRRHPTPVLSASKPTPVPEQDLSQYATTPPVTRMRIVSDIIPWSIPVRSRPSDPKPYIRVLDVLEAIHQSLRSGVNEREWDRAPKQYRDRVKRAYFERCARARAYTLEGYEERQGIRRVDWLLEKTMFMGLATISNARDSNGEDEGSSWAMMLAPRR